MSSINVNARRRMVANLTHDWSGFITFPKKVSRRAFRRRRCSSESDCTGLRDQIVLSHDVFLKQMWAKNGGNGWGFVCGLFLAYLAARGVNNDTLRKLCIDNPARLLTA